MPAQPFAVFRQLVFNSKDTFLQIAERARAFANGSDSRLVLEQLAASKQRTGERPAPNVFAVHSAPAPVVRHVFPSSTKPCYDFMKGVCVRPFCRYLHPLASTKIPASSLEVCAHCGKRGHNVSTCFALVGFPPRNNGGKGVGRGKGVSNSTRSFGRGRGAGGVPPVDANAFLFDHHGTDMSALLDAVELRQKERAALAARVAVEESHHEHSYMVRVVGSCALSPDSSDSRPVFALPPPPRVVLFFLGAVW